MTEDGLELSTLAPEDLEMDSTSLASENLNGVASGAQVEKGLVNNAASEKDNMGMVSAAPNRHWTTKFIPRLLTCTSLIMLVAMVMFFKVERGNESQQNVTTLSPNATGPLPTTLDTSNSTPQMALPSMVAVPVPVPSFSPTDATTPALNSTLDPTTAMNTTTTTSNANKTDTPEEETYCREDNECPKGVCAWKQYESFHKVCCESGESIALGGIEVCKGGTPEGEDCGYHEALSDAACAGGVCIKGVCDSSKLGPNELCDQDHDCQSGGVCAWDKYYANHKVCCESGESVAVGGNEVCKHGTPDGENCGYYEELSDAVCASGICLEGICKAAKLNATERCKEKKDCQSGACAAKSISLSYWNVCCPSNETITLSNKEVCKGLSDGEECGYQGNVSDSVCASGACLSGKCASTTFGPNEACDRSHSCKNNNTCSYKDYWSYDTICCASVTLGDKTVCKGVPDGDSCGYHGAASDSVCASGICMHGTCASAKLGPNELCDKNNHCQSGACAYKDYWTFASQIVCCESGESVSFDDDLKHVCTGIPDGQECGDDGTASDSICASGMCIKGHCASERLNSTESCARNSDCKSGACGTKDYWAFLKVCCEGGATVTTTYGEVCTGLQEGQDCGRDGATSDSLCASGLCLDGTCSDACTQGHFWFGQRVCCASGWKSCNFVLYTGMLLAIVVTMCCVLGACDENASSTGYSASSTEDNDAA